MNNPSEFNAVVNTVIAQGLNLVENKKMSVETMMGILECHQMSVFQWRMEREFEAQQAAAEERGGSEDQGPPLIIHPGGTTLVK